MTERNELTVPSEVERLREALAARERELSEVRDSLVRLQADFDNYRKRMEREREALAEEISSREILDFLPVYDSLERALEALERDGDIEGFAEGIRKILSQFREILARKGCEPFDSVGKRFDPAYHEAILVENSQAQRNTVIAELERGWLRGGKVLRPAKVVVSLGPEGGDRNG